MGKNACKGESGAKCPRERAGEVAELLRLVATGKVVPVVVGETWREVYAGNVEFSVAGHKIVIFNDCDAWDYIDSVTFPDGGRVGFGRWEDGVAPDSLLYQQHPELVEPMERAFENATAT